MGLINDQKKKNDPRSIPLTQEIAQLTEQVQSPPMSAEASASPSVSESSPEQQILEAQPEEAPEEGLGQVESPEAVS